MSKIAYVGCRTTRERNARGKGLKVFEINESTKEWNEIQLISDLENPSYMCLDNNKEYLYTVHGDSYSVSSFKIEKETGKLSFINRINSLGRNPVFITVDKTNSFVYVACLQGGAVFTLKKNDDGSLSEPLFEAKLPGKTEAGVSHAHQCIWDQNKEYLFVPAQGRSIGYSEINIFRANEDGSLTLTQCHRTRELDEARHVAVHGNNRYVYGVNEKDNSVTFYIFNEKAGALEPKQVLTALPDIYVGEGQASAILVHPNNKFLYESNRIHESITVFALDEYTGYMKYLYNFSSFGKTPRFMTFDPEGKQLIVANEDSDDIRMFDVNQNTGELIYSGQYVETESPVCIIFNY
jgi:6-phosphogluconolactonase (cycloisomerase 2 family)